MNLKDDIGTEWRYQQWMSTYWYRRINTKCAMYLPNSDLIRRRSCRRTRRLEEHRRTPSQANAQKWWLRVHYQLVMKTAIMTNFLCKFTSAWKEDAISTAGNTSEKCAFDCVQTEDSSSQKSLRWTLSLDLLQGIWQKWRKDNLLTRRIETNQIKKGLSNHTHLLPFLSLSCSFYSSQNPCDQAQCRRYPTAPKMGM